jgi:hypothetical protein
MPETAQPVPGTSPRFHAICRRFRSILSLNCSDSMIRLVETTRFLRPFEQETVQSTRGVTAANGTEMAETGKSLFMRVSKCVRAFSGCAALLIGFFVSAPKALSQG